MTGNAIETFDLRKVYNEEKVAVQGLTLQVKRGEVFGYLGPNGAGKTTSIKMLLGLVKPTSGSGFLLGEPIGQPIPRAQVGFLPEHFRFHEWMQAAEFLDFHGRLYGMSKADRQARIPAMLELVELSDVANKRLSTFSKGMLQRAGLAMSLLPRPEIVFLDEPTSGLDPFGRLLVRDVIRRARSEGTTVFLNSHLLSEVEVTCDRVAFIRLGKVVKAGSIEELAGGLVAVRLKFDAVPSGLPEDINSWGTLINHNVRAQKVSEREVELSLPLEDYIPDLTNWLVGQGLQVYAVTPHRVSLEDLFVQIMQDQPQQSGSTQPSTQHVPRKGEPVA